MSEGRAEKRWLKALEDSQADRDRWKALAEALEAEVARLRSDLFTTRALAAEGVDWKARAEALEARLADDALAERVAKKVPHRSVMGIVNAYRAAIRNPNDGGDE